MPELGDNLVVNELKQQTNRYGDQWTQIKDIINPYDYVDARPNEPKCLIQYDTNAIYNPNALYPVVSRAYFKLWEILTDFKVIERLIEQNNGRPLQITNLAEGPGGFINCLIDYRNRIMTKGEYKEDQYNAITLASNRSKEIPDWEKSKQYFNKLKEGGYHVNLSYGKSNGDLTNVNVLKTFIEEIGSQKSDLVTADGELAMKNEQEYHIEDVVVAQLFLAEIIGALMTQAKGGTFILKVFEIDHEIMYQLLQIVVQYYDEVHLFKPKMSRPARFKKYLICQKFRGIDQDTIGRLLGLLDQWTQQKKFKQGAGTGTGEMYVRPDLPESTLMAN